MAKLLICIRGLRFKNIVVIDSEGDLREKLVKEAHDSFIRGHASVQNSYKRLKTVLLAYYEKDGGKNS